VLSFFFLDDSIIPDAVSQSNATYAQHQSAAAVAAASAASPQKSTKSGKAASAAPARPVIVISSATGLPLSSAPGAAAVPAAASVSTIDSVARMSE
jgi:hypothetical protein